MTRWNEQTFDKWLALREKFSIYKKNKDWIKLISVCDEIIRLDEEAKFIGIMVPLFYKDIAYAHEKLGEISNALNYYQLAKDGLLKYRSEKPLSKPDDWLDIIRIIDKKITKLIGR